jgi:hypothetical protein
MFGTRKDSTKVCDASCRAQQLREAALFKAARFGPRI